MAVLLLAGKYIFPCFITFSGSEKFLKVKMAFIFSSVLLQRIFAASRCYGYLYFYHTVVHRLKDASKITINSLSLNLILKSLKY